MHSIHEREGVIKYQLTHTACDLPASVDIRPLNAWRSLLFRLQLIGQTAEKYNGLGYGNISQRLNNGEQSFLISGTQTGHLPILARQDFALVETASPLQNSITSSGPSRPSSEALTHASVYLHDILATTVIHVHCQEIWHNTQALSLPHTCADIAYGSVEMAEAVADLFASGQLRQLPLFCMLGHQDGVVALGPSLNEAAQTLLTQLAKALVIEQTTSTG